MSVLERLWPRAEEKSEHDLSMVDTDPLEEVFEVLSNSRRRAVVILLDEGPTELGILADEIAALEAGPNYDTTDRKAAYVGLWQAHMPMLAEHGIVARDGREGRWRSHVEPGPNHARALAALAAVQDVVAEDGGVR